MFKGEEKSQLEIYLEEIDQKSKEKSEINEKFDYNSNVVSSNPMNSKVFVEFIRSCIVRSFELSAELFIKTLGFFLIGFIRDVMFWNQIVFIDSSGLYNYPFNQSPALTLNYNTTLRIDDIIRWFIIFIFVFSDIVSTIMRNNVKMSGFQCIPWLMGIFPGFLSFLLYQCRISINRKFKIVAMNFLVLIQLVKRFQLIFFGKSLQTPLPPLVEIEKTIIYHLNPINSDPKNDLLVCTGLRNFLKDNLLGLAENLITKMKVFIENESSLVGLDYSNLSPSLTMDNEEKSIFHQFEKLIENKEKIKSLASTTAQLYEIHEFIFQENLGFLNFLLSDELIWGFITFQEKQLKDIKLSFPHNFYIEKNYITEINFKHENEEIEHKKYALVNHLWVLLVSIFQIFILLGNRFTFGLNIIAGLYQINNILLNKFQFLQQANDKTKLYENMNKIFGFKTSPIKIDKSHEISKQDNTTNKITKISDQYLNIRKKISNLRAFYDEISTKLWLCEKELNDPAAGVFYFSDSHIKNEEPNFYQNSYKNNEEDTIFKEKGGKVVLKAISKLLGTSYHSKIATENETENERKFEKGKEDWNLLKLNLFELLEMIEGDNNSVSNQFKHQKQDNYKKIETKKLQNYKNLQNSELNIKDQASQYGDTDIFDSKNHKTHETLLPSNNEDFNIIDVFTTIVPARPFLAPQWEKRVNKDSNEASQLIQELRSHLQLKESLNNPVERVRKLDGENGQIVEMQKSEDDTCMLKEENEITKDGFNEGFYLASTPNEVFIGNSVLLNSFNQELQELMKKSKLLENSEGNTISSD